MNPPYTPDHSRETHGRVYCTKEHADGEHDKTCMPPAEPANAELRLLRAIFGLCPVCNRTDEHIHIAHSFLVRAGGRLFRITPLESFHATGDDWVPVDCRDSRTTFESQAIIEASTAQTAEFIIAESQVRDAIRSAYLNATSHESGQYPAGGTHLPEDFEIKVL